MPRVFIYGPPKTGKTSLLVPFVMGLFPGMLHLGDARTIRHPNAVYTDTAFPADEYDMIFETYVDPGGVARVRRVK